VHTSAGHQRTLPPDGALLGLLPLDLDPRQAGPWPLTLARGVTLVGANRVLMAARRWGIVHAVISQVGLGAIDVLSLTA
jgi:hypothetical protein